jgi:signal transduction histidine kinase
MFKIIQSSLSLSYFATAVAHPSSCGAFPGAIFAFFLIALLCYFYFFYRKRLEKLSEEISVLRDINQLRGMFVSIVSHELRNPMTTIYSSIDLLENYLDRIDIEEKQQLFENIRKSIQRMSKMMDDIVLIGRLQHGQVNCHPEQTNILLLCSGICEALGSEKKRIRMTVDCQLPLFVNIDQSLVNIILSNLINNALKYSEELIDFSIKLCNDTLIFDIQDQGIGIPNGEIQKLSQLFGRCSNTGNRKGIGIGMFLVPHCVKLHKGTVKVYSQTNEGTHFKVAIPLSYV